MNERQRDLIADKVVDLGHVVFGALVIGQFVDGQPWGWEIFWSGVMATASAYAIALWLVGRDS